eukprot:7946324-Heterocapsa_arctica.AAC.1
MHTKGPPILGKVELLENRNQTQLAKLTSFKIGGTLVSYHGTGLDLHGKSPYRGLSPFQPGIPFTGMAGQMVLNDRGALEDIFPAANKKFLSPPAVFPRVVLQA